jgi:hypothetical protein
MNKELVEQKENNQVGRPSKYSKKTVKRIVELLAQGKTVRDITRLKSMPCWETLRNWINKYPEFQEQYAKAKADGIEFILANAEDLLNDNLEKAKTETKTDLGKTHLVKAAVDLAKWKAEKLSPKVYGKQSELNVKAGDQLIQVKWSD